MGTVHVVATPIGNLEDITLRALRVLKEADVLYAEDTRRTRILLQRHEIAARPVSLGSHNEARRIDEALDLLGRGGRVALVSDAGTPLISDPGGRLIEAAVRAGHTVESIPGPSAVLAALSVSGLRAQPFTFVGFLPRKGAARRKLLADYAGRPETLVIFESPHRVAATLAELASVFGAGRRACVARELTKLHEQVARGELAALAEEFVEGGRGEFTLVIEGLGAGEAQPVAEPARTRSIEDEVAALAAEGRRPREIAALLAPGSGMPRRSLYALAVAAQKAAQAVGEGSDDLGRADSRDAEGAAEAAASGTSDRGRVDPCEQEPDEARTGERDRGGDDELRPVDGVGGDPKTGAVEH